MFGSRKGGLAWHIVCVNLLEDEAVDGRKCLTRGGETCQSRKRSNGLERRSAKGRRRPPRPASCQRDDGAHSQGQAWGALDQTGDCHRAFQGPSRRCEAAAPKERHNFGANPEKRGVCRPCWSKTRSSQDESDTLPGHHGGIETRRAPSRFARGARQTGQGTVPPAKCGGTKRDRTESSQDSARSPDPRGAQRHRPQGRAHAFGQRLSGGATEVIAMPNQTPKPVPSPEPSPKPEPPPAPGPEPMPKPEPLPKPGQPIPFFGSDCSSARRNRRRADGWSVAEFIRIRRIRLQSA